MIRVLISDIKHGMKLAQPVQNDSGMVLLADGIELTPSIINRLNKMGLTSIMIQGKGTSKKSKEEVLIEIDARFKKTENEQYMLMLKTILIEHVNEIYKS